MHMTRLALIAALLMPLVAHAQQPITPEQQALGITAWIATMTQELAGAKAAGGACQAELVALKAKPATPLERPVQIVPVPNAATPAPEAPKP
jgi:hypothetical protein